MIVPILPIFVAIVLAVSIVRIVISLIHTAGNVASASSARLVGEIVALYGFAIVFLYATLLVGALALYYLIDRRNSHFRRQQQLFAMFGKYLASKTGTQSSENISRLAQIAEDEMFDEQDRPAGLWAILYLFVTPIAGLVAAYNLTQDLRKHNELQSTYQQHLVNAFGEAGIIPSLVEPHRTQKRDPILFIILTAITGGLFWIYWFHTLLKDYNDHFALQATFENRILASMRPKQTATLCSACGGSVPQDARFCPSCGRPQ
jgi:hypothetical protein